MESKKILIDARLYGPKHTGIGRYVKNLLQALITQPNFKKYSWHLLVYQDQLPEIKENLSNHFIYHPTTIKHYSLSEQLFLPFLIFKINPDLVHFTHFNKPLLYFKKSVVTIHDLIKHFSTGPETTTKNKYLYWLKHFSYLFLTNIVIKTNNLIVPSNFWRNYLIKNFSIKPNQVTTTYEAIDPNFIIKPLNSNQPKNYLIYTGNLYPHKNIEIILSSLQKLPDIKLKVICSRSVFSDRLQKKIKKMHLENQVDFLGYIDDLQFQKIYSQALCLVHPSFYEGFSLTGLEAMSLGCPVISSNSSCLPEIYQDSCLYFDPNSSDQLIQNILLFKNNSKLRQEYIKKGYLQVKKYSWKTTASQTLAIYEQQLS
ncbi:MAG TPA: glycosyltransferase family 1 protein [Candidatus Woesebacteria bacterium]|nr:glycosyltransferase family 1 protein [Candidatus Woesebacteria bacterium]